MRKCRLCGMPLTANYGHGTDVVRFYPSRKDGEKRMPVCICLTCFFELIEQNTDILAKFMEVEWTPRIKLDKEKMLKLCLPYKRG